MPPSPEQLHALADHLRLSRDTGVRFSYQPTPRLHKLRPEPLVKNSTPTAIPAASPAPEFADLDALNSYIKTQNTLSIARYARHCITGRGNPKARIFVLSEPPHREADDHGDPFAGPLGRLLRSLLESLALLEGCSWYLCPVVFWRPPGGKPPTPEELRFCAPLIANALALVDPDWVVTFGPTARDMLFPDPPPYGKILSTNGKILSTKHALPQHRAVPLLGLATLYDAGTMKKQAWDSLCALLVEKNAAAAK